MSEGKEGFAIGIVNDLPYRLRECDFLVGASAPMTHMQACSHQKPQYVHYIRVPGFILALLVTSSLEFANDPRQLITHIYSDSARVRYLYHVLRLLCLWFFITHCTKCFYLRSLHTSYCTLAHILFRYTDALCHLSLYLLYFYPDLYRPF